jgi:hypothetical protein
VYGPDYNGENRKFSDADEERVEDVEDVVVDVDRCPFLSRPYADEDDVVTKILLIQCPLRKFRISYSKAAIMEMNINVSPNASFLLLRIHLARAAREMQAISTIQASRIAIAKYESVAAFCSVR